MSIDKAREAAAEALRNLCLGIQSPTSVADTLERYAREVARDEFARLPPTPPDMRKPEDGGKAEFERLLREAKAEEAGAHKAVRILLATVAEREATIAERDRRIADLELRIADADRELDAAATAIADASALLSGQQDTGGSDG